MAMHYLLKPKKLTIAIHILIVSCFAFLANAQVSNLDEKLDLYHMDENSTLDRMASVIDSLLDQRVTGIFPLISNYKAKAEKTSQTYHIGQSHFFKSVFYNIELDSMRATAASTASEYIQKNLTYFEGIEWAERLIELKIIRAKALHVQSLKNEAIELRYELINDINKLHDDYPKSEYQKYHILNYFSITNVFLFDNDEISTRYADSCILWATRYQDDKYLFSAYSIKYYSLYYGDNGLLLNTIADSCIYYALITQTIKNKGEAYMHKCNALVVLGQYNKGLRYCNMAVAEYQQLGDSAYLSSTLNNMGNVFKKVNQTDKVIQFYEQALSYSSPDFKESYLNSVEALASELYLANRFKESATYYHDFTQEYYSFYKDQLTTKFAEAEAKNQTEIKETEIARQQLVIARQDNTRKLLIGGALGGIGLLGALFFGFYQKNKSKRKEVESALLLEQDRANDLEKITKIKTDFFNNVSHELRTPLTLIIAPLEDAIAKAQHVGMKSDLEIAMGNSKRLLNLTNEILDLSKIDGSGMKIELAKIQLLPFLQRVLHSYHSLAAMRKIDLIEEFDIDSKIHIETDIAKLEKILNNLISNAIKYSNNNGRVTLTLNENAISKSILNITVKDNGIGIPLDEQPHIFDRFYQSSQVSQSSGTGIGLALVKELVDLLKGTISLTSEENSGSAFTFNIPVIKSIKSVIQEEEEEEEEPTTKLPITNFVPILIDGNKPRILIVEDDIEMSKYITGLLNQDFECHTAFNGAQALEKLQTQKYDLISSDIMMPEMDGFEFRKIVNKDHRINKTPFIMLTARALEEDKLKGLQMGIDDYITKPFHSVEFKTRVNNLLRNKIERDTIHTSEPDIPFESTLITRAKEIVMEYIDDPILNVEFLAQKLNYSSRQLGRILQRTTGFSPVAFILEIRLQQAFKLIQQRKLSTINEVRYSVGIDSASYFSNKFKERFGISPGHFDSSVAKG